MDALEIPYEAATVGVDDKDWNEIYDFYENNEYTYLAVINGKVYCKKTEIYGGETVSALSLTDKTSDPYGSYNGYYAETICYAADRIVFHGDYFESISLDGYSVYYAVDGIKTDNVACQHYVITYGDNRRKIKDLCSILGIEVFEI